MSEGDASGEVRPLANLLQEVGDGRLSVRLSPEEFVEIDRDCEYFKLQIREVQRLMRRVDSISVWGIGDGYSSASGQQLVSGSTLASRYRGKAVTDENSVWNVMESHYKIVEDYQSLFRTVREKFAAQDSDWAAKYDNAAETLPERPPAAPRIFSWPGLR